MPDERALRQNGRPIGIRGSHAASRAEPQDRDEIRPRPRGPARTTSQSGAVSPAPRQVERDQRDHVEQLVEQHEMQVERIIEQTRIADKGGDQQRGTQST